MQDKKTFRLEGEYAILEEVMPKYFPDIVRWRNNRELNRFINQPFVLTEEKEKEWYENIYLPDESQGLMMMIDRKSNIPFGTWGWTDMDCEHGRCVTGRLMVGVVSFRFSFSFMEAMILLNDYLFTQVSVTYAHMAKKNRNVIRLSERFGSVINHGEIQYPHYLSVNGMEMIEMVRSKEMYEIAKKQICQMCQFGFEKD